MTNRGIHPAAIEVFARYYRDVEAGARGTIPEAGITPLADLPQLEAFSATEAERAEALRRTAMVKLNGGLGTSMGLDLSLIHI